MTYLCELKIKINIFINTKIKNDIFAGIKKLTERN